MKTVRFSNVVKKSGKPEVYVLLSRDDQEFKKALKSNRIMSLLGGTEGSKSGYGIVGYEEKQHAQLLLFPKSLASFENIRVVGIKYDLFSDADEGSSSRKAVLSKAAVSTRKADPKQAKAAEPKEKKPRAVKTRQEKVIPFPKREEPEEEENESISEIKGFVVRALRALEKNNSVAAYNLLKRIVPDAG